MHRINITDGEHSSYRAGVDTQHRLKVTSTDSRNYPEVNPPDTPNYYRFLSGLLGTTGLGSGTTSQDVDGSVTPVTFYMTARQEYDIYVTDIIISILDGSISHAKFGALTALTNGWDLKVRESGEETYLVEKAKSNGEILSSFAIMSPFGSGSDLNIITNYNGANDDAFIAPIELDETLPYGFRLGRGSNDRLEAIVNDDLTGLSAMYVKVLGYKHYPIGSI